MAGAMMVGVDPVAASILLGLLAWVPNTFYAKTGGRAWGRGVVYLWSNIRVRPLLWLLIAIRPLLGGPWRRTGTLTAIAAGYLLYVASVGGDFKPTGRFIIPMLPFLAVIAAESVVRLWDRLPSARLIGAFAVAVGIGGSVWLQWETAGHEKSDPDYVFSRAPDLYLPEDHMFVLKPWTLEPDDNFPADFQENYTSVSLQFKGRWLNVWVRQGGLLAPRG